MPSKIYLTRKTRFKTKSSKVLICQKSAIFFFFPVHQQKLIPVSTASHQFCTFIDTVAIAFSMKIAPFKPNMHVFRQLKVYLLFQYLTT